MVKSNGLTYKWLATGVLLPFVVAALWYYVHAQDTAKVVIGKRIDTVAAQCDTNRDTIVRIAKELAVFRAEVKGDMKTLKRLMEIQLQAQGVPQRIIETAKNGDSVRDTT
jgi:hypothetical protein